MGEGILPVLISRLDCSSGVDLNRVLFEAEQVCALVGVDFSAIREEVQASMPDPASWEKLRRLEEQASSSLSSDGGAEGGVSGGAPHVEDNAGEDLDEDLAVA